MNLATELGKFCLFSHEEKQVFVKDLFQFLLDLEIDSTAWLFFLGDNCWVEMHYKHLRAVDRLFKDMIILYLIHSCTVLDENSQIQVDIAAEHRNNYKSYLPKITVHLVDK